MKFRFSLKTTIIGGLLILAMCRASYWQWQRHQSKLDYINILQQRIEKPIRNISEILEENIDAAEIAYRRAKISGDYDFSREMILRNRKVDDVPGVFLLTPMKLTGTGDYILISRGFIPLSYSAADKRKVFQNEKNASFIGLLKEGQTAKMFEPVDPPTGPGEVWVDAWLRVDLEKMSKQLPYKLLPVYAEIMAVEDSAEAQAKIVTSTSQRDEMFYLAGKSNIPAPPGADEISEYPQLSFNTVVPPGRHLGYVFEWAAMALLTLGICIILQFRRPRSA